MDKLREEYRYREIIIERERKKIKMKKIDYMQRKKYRQREERLIKRKKIERENEGRQKNQEK